MANKDEKSKIKVLIIVLSILLTVSVAALVVINVRNAEFKNEPAVAKVTDNIITPQSENGDNDITTNGEDIATYETDNSSTVGGNSANSGDTANDATKLSLYDRQPGVNTPFKAMNLYPGDSVVKNFAINVSHKSDVTVKYHADIKYGGGALGDVLMIRIKVGDNDVIYDGPIGKMPKALETTVSGSGVHELDYEMTAYLCTSVGNEYQNLGLCADFRWWVDEADDLGPSPNTGIIENMLVLVVLAAAVGICIFMILLYRRKGENE